MVLKYTISCPKCGISSSLYTKLIGSSFSIDMYKIKHECDTCKITKGRNISIHKEATKEQGMERILEELNKEA